ncbi:probable phosphoglycerate mutase [Natronincola peptidivorans]|uniref:Probable phosphoglycerate mutase n=1 Tax=Natronincola peptidivorans TaxID=426128 RepID=A0A1H9YK52_9FIRM|nr:histidine phosphatase family protein [Natronincola peptidivorans]SES69366.1 probable phosphoglycerate mutase [Natronincola peptidivorans]
MKKIYIVRHGETNWNLEGKTQGKKDSKLTELGYLQTQKLAHRLSEEKIEVIYSSNLVRAKSTAIMISKQLNVPYYYEENLAEMDFGEWEGLTNDEIIKLYPDKYNGWRMKPHEVCIPRGESLIAAQKRIVSFFEELIKTTNYNKILLISHSTINKLLLLYILGMNLSNYYILKQDNCCINILSFGKYGPRLLNYNDTCYIKS